MLAHNLICWTAILGNIRVADELTVARTMRTRLVAIPARLVNRGGRPTLRLPTRWPWATTFITALDALRLPAPSTQLDPHTAARRTAQHHRALTPRTRQNPEPATPRHRPLCAVDPQSALRYRPIPLRVRHGDHPKPNGGSRNKVAQSPRWEEDTGQPIGDRPGPVPHAERARGLCAAAGAMCLVTTGSTRARGGGRRVHVDDENPAGGRGAPAARRTGGGAT